MAAGLGCVLLAAVHVAVLAYAGWAAVSVVQDGGKELQLQEHMALHGWRRRQL